LLFNIPISSGISSLNIEGIQQSASLYPEIINNNTIFLELVIAILVTLSYLLFTRKLKHPGNRFFFTLLMLMILFFISLFKINPPALPALNDRLMGLNVVQWGLVLAGFLLSAYIISQEMSTSKRKKEILKKAPAEYRLLTIFLFLILFSYQATSLFRDSEIKILIIGYFITAGFMVSYFLRKVEKHYLRYGTVSIILLACILYIYSDFSDSGSRKLNDFDHINTPQKLIDPSFLQEEYNPESKGNMIKTSFSESLGRNNVTYMISGFYQMKEPAEFMMGENIESYP